MANFYVLVSTHKEGERDSFYKNKQLIEKKLSIGWGEINPINKSIKEIKKAIEEFYPSFKGTVNPDNGSKSLLSFCNSQVGDIVFVRGDAKIVDVVILTGTAVFELEGHYENDYFLKVPFIPLFSDNQSLIDTKEIPKSIYKEVLFTGGRSLVNRQISEKTARTLIKALAKKI